jgi:hypothetical protein
MPAQIPNSPESQIRQWTDGQRDLRRPQPLDELCIFERSITVIDALYFQYVERFAHVLRGTFLARMSYAA